MESALPALPSSSSLSADPSTSSHAFSSVDKMLPRQFLPPVNRSMKVLDKSFFQKTVSLSAARIFDVRRTGEIRKICRPDALHLPKIDVLQWDPDQEKYKGRKVMILKPEVKHDDLSTVSEATRRLVEEKAIELIPYDLKLNYDHWGYDDIIAAVLPDTLTEIPTSFAQAGHLAHLNLRTEVSEYRHLIGSIILSKNPQLSTVVNKLEDVGTGSVFRTFPMEVIAGEPNTVVEVKESNCIFRFDFAKVYWNSRLGYEHERIVKIFNPGEAISDVMCGVGPFALPAAKKGCIVYANDLNPESIISLRENIKINKVNPWINPYNIDGRAFIRHSIQDLYAKHCSGNPLAIPPRPPRSPLSSKPPIPQVPKMVPYPITFAHFVMNLPASAVEFIDAFIGSYNFLTTQEEREEMKKHMPTIHVHTFHREQPGSEEEAKAKEDVVGEVSKYLEHKMEVDQVDVYEVRRVAPNKVMYCASFKLPVEVAFREIEEREAWRMPEPAMREIECKALGGGWLGWLRSWWRSFWRIVWKGGFKI